MLEDAQKLGLQRGGQFDHLVKKEGPGIGQLEAAFAAAVGPALDELAENAGTDLAGVGALFTVMFVGSLAAQVIVCPLIDRIGQRPVMVAAILLVVPSYVGITLSTSVPMLLAFGVIAGLGFAALDVS